MFVLSVSGGNDSVALVRYAYEKNLDDVYVIHCNTGWAHPDWAARVGSLRMVSESYGFKFMELQSEGMERLVKRKKGWPFPSSEEQFCTQYLKREPLAKWLDSHDLDCEAVVMVGVRREESANRSNWPEWSVEDGRDKWAPLVRHTETMRDELIANAGFQVLPHRSRECWPCINANRATLRTLDQPRIDKIQRIESEMGMTRLGKPRVMFRPHRYMGATGIVQVIRWAHSEHGKYEPEPLACEGGHCGN